MNRDTNGRYVTARELADKLNSLRWELRCYALVLVLAVIVQRFELPQQAAALALRVIH